MAVPPVITADGWLFDDVLSARLIGLRLAGLTNCTSTLLAVPPFIRAPVTVFKVLGRRGVDPQGRGLAVGAVGIAVGTHDQREGRCSQRLHHSAVRRC